MIVSSWCCGSAWNSCHSVCYCSISLSLGILAGRRFPLLTEFLISMQKYADKDPRWSLHAEEGPAQILVYFSCCHHKLLKNRFLVGRKGNGKEEESTLSFWKSYLSFHWSFSSGCLMVCVNWCASVSCLRSFPSVLVFHCAWHWCGITTGSVR